MERLTDEQIDKADKKVRSLARLFLDGEAAKNERDWKENNRRVLMFGTTTLRQFIRVINDLRYYKQLSEKRGKALEWYADESEEEARKFHFGTIKSDIGERAREALQEDTP